jgi:hypothetical protein
MLLKVHFGRKLHIAKIGIAAMLGSAVQLAYSAVQINSPKTLGVKQAARAADFTAPPLYTRSRRGVQ